MRLVCPSCDAAYEVPDDRLGSAPRRLRCARCAHEWTVDPAQAAPPAPAPPPWQDDSPPLSAVAPSPRSPVSPLMGEARRPPATLFPDYDDEDDDADDAEPGAPASRVDRMAIAAWVASMVLLVGLVIMAVQFRAEIMRGWPASERLYAVFGAAPR